MKLIERIAELYHEKVIDDITEESVMRATVMACGS